MKTWFKSSASLALMAVITTAVVACGPAAPPAATPAPQATAAPKVAATQPAASKSGPTEPDQAKAPASANAKESDTAAKYDAMVQAAKKEGKITVSNSQAVVREPLIAAFKQKFGIEVDYLHLSAGDLFTRLRTERQAGQYNVDAVLSGGMTFVGNMIPEGMIDKLDDVLILPEATDPTKWVDGKIPWLDPEHRVLRLNKYVSNYLTINPEVVKKGEVTGFKDLLDPKWKGKIAAHDPTIPGGGANAAAFLLVTFGEDFIKQLYLGQEVVFSRDERQMSDWLGRGKNPILIWGSNAATLADMKNAGLPFEVVVAQDASPLEAGWGMVGMVNKAPHPNAAKLFINWLASKDGQEAWAAISKWPVTRTDVDQSSLADNLKLKPGVKYTDMADYEFLTKTSLDAQKRLRELIQR